MLLLSENFYKIYFNNKLIFVFKDKAQLVLESFTFILVSLFSIILVYYLIRNEAKLQQYPIVFSLIIYILITLNHIIPLIRSKSRHLATIEYGSFVIFNIIAIYSILPLRKRYTILLSALISIKNIVLLSFFLFNSEFHYVIILRKVRKIFNKKFNFHSCMDIL